MYSTRIPRRRKVSKYRATPTVEDGIRFDSKAEAAFYGKLKLEKLCGVINYIIRQVSFDLPGGYKHRVDFMTVTNCMGGRQLNCFYEVKGRDLSLGKMKRKQVEDLYGIKIHVMRAVYSKGKIIGFEEVEQ